MFDHLYNISIGQPLLVVFCMLSTVLIVCAFQYVINKKINKKTLDRLEFLERVQSDIKSEFTTIKSTFLSDRKFTKSMLDESRAFNHDLGSKITILAELIDKSIEKQNGTDMKVSKIEIRQEEIFNKIEKSQQEIIKFLKNDI